MLSIENPYVILKLLFCGVGAVLLPIYTLRHFVTAFRTFREAQSWPVTRGTILESVVYLHGEKKVENFRIRYEFTLEERIEGDTPRASGDFFYTDQLQRAFVNRYRSGQEVDVFYCPRNPRNNCIDRTDRSGVVAKAGMFLITVFVSGVFGWGIFKLVSYL